MSRAVVILRPQPGAARTAERASALGLEPVAASIFTIAPLAWTSPDPARFDAVLMTSANAARHSGPALQGFVRLPCYAVGEATAEAAREAGFGDVRTGPSDGDAALAMMRTEGVRRAFHPHGRDHVPLSGAGVEVEGRAVYASDPSPELSPDAIAAIEEGALVLLHSPRAASQFSKLADQARLSRASVRLAAISPTAAAAAGSDWLAVHSAPRPRDEALLELAAKLCQIDRGAAAGTNG